MPAKWFQCPDGVEIPIEDCLKRQGCRMNERCANLPFLRSIAYDREWRGITPSMAGNGPLLIALKKEMPYAMSPDSRTFAVLGTGVHGKMALHQYTYNVLAEEPLSDDLMKGIADVLEEDEDIEGQFILEDWKTWGSYKAAMAMGMVSEEVPLLDADGKPYAFFQSGPRKGQPKTEKRFKIDSVKIDMKETELQLNRYRIFFEKAGFPISRINVIAIVRDGGTQIARSRGIERNLYVIPVKRLDDEDALKYYARLRARVNDTLEALKTGGKLELCNAWECWEGRRCENFCEVADHCKRLAKRPDNWRG